MGLSLRDPLYTKTFSFSFENFIPIPICLSKKPFSPNIGVKCELNV